MFNVDMAFKKIINDPYPQKAGTGPAECQEKRIDPPGGTRGYPLGCLS